MRHEDIAVEVVFALPERCWIVPLRLPAGAQVREAVLAANLAERVGAGFSFVATAVRGRLVDEVTPLRDGDRVELLRPLEADPKQARRDRAAKPGRPG